MLTSDRPELASLLRQTFGYDSFRPLQREIMEASLAGRDVFALLPTGGGKSLCFQLPALIREGLTVVVSPLIALMKDQVDQLEAAGVEATFLNSSLGAADARKRLARLHEGKYKLLYVAPERLMLENWQDNLRSWNVTSLAIDEAHCISEWGHDFRPEYRQLARLRQLLPEIPVMALTATATERVREDIVRHLRLREPATFVASFNRPNLFYRVVAKTSGQRQLLEFVRSRKGEGGIVYCASRAASERVAESLQHKGYAARPYHAGLSSKERATTQDLFLRDELRIVCATIAFGMGINKPNVRWVVHYDLPKNLEGYYQETGRAGRDGLPSECLLLFSPGDAAKQRHFLEEISDPQEKDIARRQLSLMLHYAESRKCRRTDLLGYFGEKWGETNCGACDNCLEPRETYDGTVPAQKFLSCVLRIRQAGRFGVGINHVCEVLTGSKNEKILRWGHDQLSTFGIGKEFTRPEWAAVGRELLRLGLLAQTSGSYPVLEATPEGLQALRERRKILLTKPMTVAKEKKSPGRRQGNIVCDEDLFEDLRTLRKRLADERGVPAYVIFGDATLRHMAREYPSTLEELSRVSGIGEKKLQSFGQEFVAAVTAFLANNTPRVFDDAE